MTNLWPQKKPKYGKVRVKKERRSNKYVRRFGHIATMKSKRIGWTGHVCREQTIGQVTK